VIVAVAGSNLDHPITLDHHLARHWRRAGSIEYETAGENRPRHACSSVPPAAAQGTFTGRE
jgi:hypothetical protein